MGWVLDRRSYIVGHLLLHDGNQVVGIGHDDVFVVRVPSGVLNEDENELNIRETKTRRQKKNVTMDVYN